MRIGEKYWLLLLVLLGVGAAAFAVLGHQGFGDVRRLRGEREELARDIERLRTQRAELEREIADLRNNPRAIEARARNDLGMIRQGETVFLLPERHESQER